MNPQWHEEFLALCALYPSGELAEEEWALLQVHLAYCDSCRHAFEEHEQMMQEVVPALAFAAASPSTPEPSSKRTQDTVSAPARYPASPSRMPQKLWMGIVAAGILCAVCFAGYRFGMRHVSSAPVASAPVGPPHTRPVIDSSPQLAVAQSEIAALRTKLQATTTQSQSTQGLLATAEEQLQKEQSQRDAISLERDQLRDQLVRSQAEVVSLQNKASAIESATAGSATRESTLEARVHELNVALDEKDRMLALDKEFLAHDKEIRDLIGARDLYIADIYDVGQNGKTSTAFGRIFYTKAKSLVFYGYDLDKQPGLKQSVAFQVWGSGDDRQDVNLGIFYQDESHKRWVLRFNDSKTLAHLNRVFVTAEPEGGSHKPTGKPLLLAYLQVQPNHP